MEEQGVCWQSGGRTLTNQEEGGRGREKGGEEEQKILNHCQYGLKSPGSLPKLQRTTNAYIIVSAYRSGK